MGGSVPMKRIRRRYKPVGGIFDFIGSVSAVGSAVDAAAAIASDPALPQVAGLILQLQQNEASTSQAQTGVARPGIGLGRLVTPLEIYVAYRQNPLVIGTLVLGALVGIPMAIGYVLGRK